MKKFILMLLAALLVLGLASVAMAAECAHVSDGIEHVDPATCYKSGKTYNICTECGQFININEIDVRQHRFMVITNEATCKNAGSKIVDCTYDDCDYHTEEVIPAKAHVLVLFREDAPTCTELGAKIEKCKNCDYEKTTLIDALGHDYKEIDKEEATCLEDGWKLEKCTRCDATKETVLPAKGHDWSVWHRTQAPTCTVAGFQQAECVRPGCFDKATGAAAQKVEVLPALGHDFAPYVVVTAATCEGEGLNRGVCDCGLTDDVVVPALGHDWNEWKVQKEATETECGVQTRTCKACTKIEYATIPCLKAEEEVPGTEDKPAEDKPAEDEKEDNNSEGTGSETGNGSDASIPATGDNGNTMAYIMMVVAAAGLVVLAASKRKVNC